MAAIPIRAGSISGARRCPAGGLGPGADAADAIWHQSASSLSGSRRPSGCGSPWCWHRMRTSSCWTRPPVAGHRPQTEVMEAIHRVAAEGRTVVLIVIRRSRHCRPLLRGELLFWGWRHQAYGPAREVVTKPLIDRLYQTGCGHTCTPRRHGAPQIVPRRRKAGTSARLRRRPWRSGLSHIPCARETA